jgi:hypothetical protein
MLIVLCKTCERDSIKSIEAEEMRGRAIANVSMDIGCAIVRQRVAGKNKINRHSGGEGSWTIHRCWIAMAQ